MRTPEMGQDGRLLLPLKDFGTSKAYRVAGFHRLAAIDESEEISGLFFFVRVAQQEDRRMRFAGLYGFDGRDDSAWVVVSLPTCCCSIRKAVGGWRGRSVRRFVIF